MIGTREPPTFSASQRYGSGFHGSPVVTNVRSDERSLAGSPWGSRARASVGESPSEVTRSCSTDAPEAVGRGPVGRALCEDDRAAERADADHRPGAHDPAHVGGEMHDVALVHVGLVGGLARDRDEEAALHVHHALRRAGRAGRVGEQVRRFGVDLERGQLAGAVRRARRERARRAPASRTRESPPRGSRASARCDRGATTRAAVIATFALARLQAAGRRPVRRSRRRSAPARRRCARSRSRRRRPRATSAGRSRRGRRRRRRAPTSSSARRVTSRESSANVSVRREPSSPSPTAATASGAGRPSGGRSCARSRSCPPRNQVVHSGPRESSKHPVPRAARTRSPGRRRRAARTTPARSGSGGRARRSRRRPRCARAASRSRARSSPRRASTPRRSRAQPYLRARVSVC